MVPVERLTLEEHIGNDAEDDEGHDFLYHLELHEGEGTTVVHKSDAVGRNLTAVLEEGNEPTEGNDANERPMGADARLAQFEMAIPSECHEDVAQDEQKDSVKCRHMFIVFIFQKECQADTRQMRQM